MTELTLESTRNVLCGLTEFEKMWVEEKRVKNLL